MLLTLRTTYLVAATTWRAGSVPKRASKRKSTTIDFVARAAESAMKPTRLRLTHTTVASEANGVV
ncbi:MAG TPA: hypothetical protein VGF24_05065 [Vicinamibacterales bacterium]|jgi:hypothetical protein